MVAATIRQLGTEPTAHPQRSECGHDRQVGTCPVASGCAVAAGARHGRGELPQAMERR